MKQHVGFIKAEFMQQIVRIWFCDATDRQGLCEGAAAQRGRAGHDRPLGNLKANKKEFQNGS